VYGYDVYCPKNRELIKEIYRHTEFVVATNLLFKELLNRNFGVPQEKIILARTVVDASKYSNSIEYTPEDRKVAEAVATQRNAFKILCVARLVYRKGVHILIHAISMLVRKKRNVVLWIVGDGVERRNLEKLAEKLGISQHVQFFGALGVENLLPLYQNCDLYCQPSITDPGGDKEGLPVAMTEAMAFEKVVIATRHADIPNVIREILVPENNAEALADAIERVIEMPEQMRKAIGVKNREIVLQEFSEKNYDRVIAGFLSL
jgi:glycosyltransferase involved in cell wall biosynthesis